MRAGNMAPRSEVACLCLDGHVVKGVGGMPDVGLIGSAGVTFMARDLTNARWRADQGASNDDRQHSETPHAAAPFRLAAVPPEVDPNKAFDIRRLAIVKGLAPDEPREVAWP
jgi:hypothetical protein